MMLFIITGSKVLYQGIGVMHRRYEGARHLL